MTCRHYRFQIPREDADDLRAADPEPCAVCDNLPKRKSQTVIWSPRVTQEARSLTYGNLHGWFLNLFRHSPSPAATAHGAPASAVSSW